jgi:bacillithiol system protein YtxJ
MINWREIHSIQDVAALRERSREVPCLIFKHSTRCSISTVAKYRLEGDWEPEDGEVELYYLDLIAHRDVSNHIAEVFKVYHESPQILLIRNGECTFDASHLDITVPEIREMLEEAV